MIFEDSVNDAELHINEYLATYLHTYILLIKPQKKNHALVIPKGKYIDLDDFSLNASSEEIVGLLKGINKDFNSSEFSNYLTEGRLPSKSEKINNEVIISDYLSKRLSINLNDKFRTTFFKIGFSIPNERNFKVVGIFKSGLIEFDQTYFLGDIRHIQKMNNWNSNQIGKAISFHILFLFSCIRSLLIHPWDVCFSSSFVR